jgi:undecaprenyl diphosphate synthase
MRAAPLRFTPRGSESCQVVLVIGGNRRWVPEHSLAAIDGHRQGMEAVVEIVRQVLALRVRSLSVFAFSTENRLDVLHGHDVRIRFLGRRGELAVALCDDLGRTRAHTLRNGDGTLGLRVNYGGRRAITDAVAVMVAPDLPPDRGCVPPALAPPPTWMTLTDARG